MSKEDDGDKAVSAGIRPLPRNVAAMMAFMLEFPIIMDRDEGVFYLRTVEEADRVVQYLKEKGYPKAKRI
jgi:hypothetical protein